MEEQMSITNVKDLNDGRNRRKVIFRSDDMRFSDLDESDNDNDDNESDIKDIALISEENNDTDSEWSDSEEETENKNNSNDKSRFYGQLFGKENEIRKKIANELAKLDKINQESNINNWNDQEQDVSEGSLEYDEDSDVENYSEYEDFKDSESDENVLDNINNPGTKTSLVGEETTNDFQEIKEDTTLNWKKNLSQKAANAYYERQNSVANLWKLVYGKHFFKK